ncbi:ABC-type transport auxiliary lipoprotein family protein [Cohaesibacter gelatinilyticus]|uniref:Cholesterol transport system auxiliary component n=1 Tax=Cohaesibacter gelatinilyticus TaxID=372072 RepID=A0A285NHK5_9HYPH|nr:ABC-type transport auxiliary lipoprotein family protein [Cohaesibacter gelatinilyticus]SNZ08925.1 cholesterol transport system auxiliary component [Cohaesibacter gelatinilyticus]
MRFGPKSKNVISILGLCFSLVACSGLGGKELTTYDLSAPEDFSSVRGRSSAQILVPVPSALKSLDSEMIVVRPSGSEITYFGDAQWSDRLPRVIQEKLIQSFENSNLVRSVAKPGEGVVVDYKISATIRQFDLIDQGSGQAKAILAVKIINDRNGRVRASRTFIATQPANLSSAETGVIALDKAADQILLEIVAWVVKVI